MANIDRFFICSWAWMRLRLNISIFLLLTCSYTHSDSIGLPGGCSHVGRRLSSFACWNIHRSFTFKVFLCIIMCLTVVFIATMCYFGEWGCSIRLKNMDDWWLTRSIWSIWGWVGWSPSVNPDWVHVLPMSSVTLMNEISILMSSLVIVKKLCVYQFTNLKILTQIQSTRHIDSYTKVKPMSPLGFVGVNSIHTQQPLN